MTQSAWFSSDCLWIAITFSLCKCQLSILKNLVHNDQLSFEMSWHHWPWTFQWSLVNWRNAAWMGPLSSWIWSLENCPVEVLLRCFKGLAGVIDRWSWLLVVNEWNAAWTVEPSSFCVSVSHYKISCHPIILIWQSVLVWFISFFFWFRVFFWPPKNWDKNKLLEMVPSQLEKYQTVTES